MLEDRQKFVGVELPANVVDEDAAADDPLSEIVPPQVLAPSRVGDGHMQVIGRKPMPEFGGDPVPERVGVGVQHHLRVFARAAGEDQQHRHIGLGMDLDRAFDLAARKLRVRPGDFGPVADPVRPFAVDEQPGGQRRAFVVNFVELVGVFGIGDDHLEFAELDPEFKALNRAELDERNRKNPPLRQPGEHEKNPVPLRNAVLDQQIRRLVREPRQVVKREVFLLAVLVAPDHGELVAVLFRPAVDDVVAEIEIIRRLDRKGVGKRRDLVRIFFRFIHFFHDAGMFLSRIV